MCVITWSSPFPLSYISPFPLPDLSLFPLLNLCSVYKSHMHPPSFLSYMSVLSLSVPISRSLSLLYLCSVYRSHMYEITWCSPSPLSYLSHKPVPTGQNKKSPTAQVIHFLASLSRFLSLTHSLTHSHTHLSRLLEVGGCPTGHVIWPKYRRSEKEQKKRRKKKRCRQKTALKEKIDYIWKF